MGDASDLCAVVVTYHPDEHVTSNLRAIVAECSRVLVIDNGSSPAERERVAVEGVECVALERNVGIAAALNIGARLAIAEGWGWIVTFDQDSTLRPGMVASLRAASRRHPAAAVVAPRIFEANSEGPPYRWLQPHARSRWLFRRTACGAVDLTPVTMAVSSGSLIDLSVWQRLGGFDEKLFIDYVDIDYCLRVVRDGRSIVVATDAKLDHQLGAREKGMVLGHAFRPTHHATFRHYYMSRNRVLTWRRHALAVPHWALFDLCFACYNALRVLGFESDRGRKLRAMLVGTWDGLRGRSGPCPEHWLRDGR